MLKYLIKRLIHGLFSVIIVVGIVMFLIYSLMNRNNIFANDPNFTKVSGNQMEIYKQKQWEKYGYLDFVDYGEDYITTQVNNGKMTAEEATEARKLGNMPSADGLKVKEWVANFTKYYKDKGYKIVRLNNKDNKNSAAFKQRLYATKDISLASRMWDYFSGLITIDNVHYVERTYGKEEASKLKNKGIDFTFKDPVDGHFSLTITGTGTKHKYLLYTDNKFPYVHQNLIKLNLGKSFTTYNGSEILDVMTTTQGVNESKSVTYPTGLTENSPINLHSLTYVSGDLDEYNAARFTDGYRNATNFSDDLSMIGNSFVIGIIATIMAYVLGVPLGILMARKKDKLADKLGTLYIVFIIAVPSLAYIFMFRNIGTSLFGLPSKYGLNGYNKVQIRILPIISLALPSIAGLMKWLRRYMIDQMNSDYVKFARSGGLSDKEIFNKHILKNAIIPIVHGIPASILGCITGAIITESVYGVPGTGKLLTTAINKSDNGVIVGLTMFYASLSVVSLILGDILMSLVDPRISFSSGGGR